MRGLVRNYSLGQGQGKQITVPIYPKSTAAALVEGTPLTNTAVSTNGAVLTIAEVGLMTSVTDLSMVSSASNVVADIGRLFGEAIARKMDLDLTALFTTFNAGVGDNTTAITAAKIFEAVAKLRAEGYDTTNDCAIILHPMIAYDLKSTITSTFAAPASMIGNSALENGYIGMLAGCPVYETSNIANTGTAGDYNGAVFHRDALGLAVQADISIETQRQAALRGFDIVGSARYGVGVLNNAAAQYLAFDSSIQA
jgi:N4-gp56 family major capsid protein